MINRVTQQTIQHNALADLQANLARVSDLQARMSSGKKITKPSDDPSGSARTMASACRPSGGQPGLRNADDGIAWLGTTDNAMQSSITALRRARDLDVQAASSGSRWRQLREAIATEIDGIRDQLLNLANTTSQGRAVFAGTTGDGKAFDDGSSATPYAWHGTTGADRRAPVVSRRDSTRRFRRRRPRLARARPRSLPCSITSRPTCAAAPRSAHALPTSTPSSTGCCPRWPTWASGTSRSTMPRQRSPRTFRIRSLSISGIEDIDLAETIMNLNMQQVAYQGALGAAAKVLQPTLMDFLR